MHTYLLFTYSALLKDVFYLFYVGTFYLFIPLYSLRFFYRYISTVHKKIHIDCKCSFGSFFVL